MMDARCRTIIFEATSQPCPSLGRTTPLFFPGAFRRGFEEAHSGSVVPHWKRGNRSAALSDGCLILQSPHFPRGLHWLIQRLAGPALPFPHFSRGSHSLNLRQTWLHLRSPRQVRSLPRLRWGHRKTPHPRRRMALSSPICSGGTMGRACRHAKPGVRPSGSLVMPGTRAPFFKRLHPPPAKPHISPSSLDIERQ